METADLQKLAKEQRYTREAGIALTIGSLILAVFLVLPIGQAKNSGAVAASSTPSAFARVPIEAKAAVVYDLTTHEMLYGVNENAQLPLASLTKLLTVYAGMQELGLSVPVTVSASAALSEAPHAFPAGSTFSLADIARLTLTGSLNDGAAAIAQTTADHEQVAVASALAATASSLGLTETYALNGNGLDVNEGIAGGYGSALDMAILAGALVKSAPDVALATTFPTATATSTNGKVFTVKNTNPTVENAPRLLLSKTGFTDLAGGNLAIVFDVGIGHPIAVVVLGSSPDARFTDVQALVAATLAHFSGIASL